MSQQVTDEVKETDEIKIISFAFQNLQVNNESKEESTESNVSGKNKKERNQVALEEDSRDFLKNFGFQVSSFATLTGSRQKCPSCSKSYMLYCWKCMIPLCDYGLKDSKLPLQVHILHHYAEKLGKATGVHAKVLYPGQVTITHFPDLPEFDYETSVLLFPSPDATLVTDLSMEEIKKIKTAFFIDSTWQSARSIWSHPSVEKLRKVKIADFTTLFWRHQTLGKTCLSTIEAIYYFCRTYAEKRDGAYNREFDNLLYLFAYNYSLIQKTYREQKREFRHIEDFIIKLDK